MWMARRWRCRFARASDTSTCIMGRNCGRREQDTVMLSFAIEAHALRRSWPLKPPDEVMAALMAKMRMMAGRPLAQYSHDWRPLPQKLVAIVPRNALRASSEYGRDPSGEFNFAVQGTEIEVATPSESTWHTRGKTRRGGFISTTPL